MVVSLELSLVLRITYLMILECLYYDYPGASSQDSDGNGPDGGSGTQGMEFLEWYGSVGISGLPADLGISYYFGYSPTGLTIITTILIIIFLQKFLFQVNTIYTYMVV